MRKVLYIFGDLAESDITWLATAGKVSTLDSGNQLITAGQQVRALSIVLDGRLAVLSSSGAKIAELAAGDIIGEMSLIEKRPPDVTVETLDKSRIISIPMDVVREKISSDTEFSARFHRALAVLLSDRLREATQRLAGTDQASSDNQSHVMDDQELDEGLLDTLHVAGDRMRRLLALLEGQDV